MRNLTIKQRLKVALQQHINNNIWRSVILANNQSHLLLLKKNACENVMVLLTSDIIISWQLFKRAQGIHTYNYNCKIICSECIVDISVIYVYDDIYGDQQLYTHTVLIDK